MTVVTEIFVREISALKERQDLAERREAHLEGLLMFVDVWSYKPGQNLIIVL